MGYLVDQKRGYASVGSRKKDLYNHIDGERCAKVKDGDAIVAFGYLHAKANNDPLFFSRYTLTDDMRQKNLFWANRAA